MLKWHGGAKYDQISLSNVDIIDCHLLQSILILFRRLLQSGKKCSPHNFVVSRAKRFQLLLYCRYVREYARVCGLGGVTLCSADRCCLVQPDKVIVRNFKSCWAEKLLTSALLKRILREIICTFALECMHTLY